MTTVLIALVRSPKTVADDCWKSKGLRLQQVLHSLQDGGNLLIQHLLGQLMKSMRIEASWPTGRRLKWLLFYGLLPRSTLVKTLFLYCIFTFNLQKNRINIGRKEPLWWNSLTLKLTKTQVWLHTFLFSFFKWESRMQLFLFIFFLFLFFLFRNSTTLNVSDLIWLHTFLLSFLNYFVVKCTYEIYHFIHVSNLVILSTSTQLYSDFSCLLFARTSMWSIFMIIAILECFLFKFRNEMEYR